LSDTDVLIIGAGHNGLVCACYLAEAGLKVRMVERRSVVGGAAVTEEFHPGFHNSLASYTVSLLNPKVIEDLGLYNHGLAIAERDISNFFPLGTKPGEYLKLSFDLDETQKEFSRYSKHDAEALPDYYNAIDQAANVLRDFVLETPPNVGGGHLAWWRLAKAGFRFRSLSRDDHQLMLDLFTKSAAEFLSQWFEHPSIMAAFAFDGIVGAYASPLTPGTAYVLLHHCFGEVNGKKGRWGHAIGGMGAITQAMRRVAQNRGVEITTDAPVKRVIVEGERARGVELENGERLMARAVASNVNPKLLFTKLMNDATLPPRFKQRMENYACGSGTFRMNVALDALPNFPCLPNDGIAEHHRSGIIIGPTIDYLDQAYLDARACGWSKRPIVEIVIPTTLDDTLAPDGKHVASLFCQHFAPELPDGGSWDDAREEAADVIIEIVNRYAPNFKDSVIARQILSPLDLERVLGLTGGDIFHGRLSLDQMFSARPALGYADYTTPVKGLFICGSGAHPGGGVTGAPGHNAAREIIRGLRRL